MTDYQYNNVFSKNVLEMITVANDYCLTLSKLENTTTPNLINYLQKVCPLIYLKCSLLPDVDVQNPEANERYFTEAEWEILFNNLRNKFKKDDEFWMIDLSANHIDPIKVSLSENLSDIFQDLKNFLILYQKNSLDAKENAVYELQHSFETRWGSLLVDAQRQLHHIRYRESQQDQEWNLPELF